MTKLVPFSPPPYWIEPDWPCPARVKSLITTRQGGVSSGAFGNQQGVNGMNPALHFGDDPQHVAQNRAILASYLPAAPQWLKQIHGKASVELPSDSTVTPEADAAFTHQRNVVCGVLTADCLPVLLCDQSATVVAAVHAGWRGLAAGVIENTIRAMQQPGQNLLAYLGPAISVQHFEVGDEVKQVFTLQYAEAAVAFYPVPDRTNKWKADLYLLARQRLAHMGVDRVYGGRDCTYTDTARFYSYRRDKTTGHLASMIWLEA